MSSDAKKVKDRETARSLDYARRVEDLNQEDMARLIMDMFHRIVIHHGLWFSEVRHQLGREKALDLLDGVFDRSYGIQMKKITGALGFELKNGIPEPLLDMSMESLVNLKDQVAKNWLASDGIWFQAVEFSRGMNDAKRCNDSCWAQFSPFEARSIKRLLGLPRRPGLSGLKRALEFRVYGSINTQSVEDEGADSFIFYMNRCRVQAARNRKGLDDYPCKSGGLVEYTTFAETIDDRIRTECIGCPPDDHPEEWFCAWKFYMEEK